MGTERTMTFLAGQRVVWMHGAHRLTGVVVMPWRGRTDDTAAWVTVDSDDGRHFRVKPDLFAPEPLQRTLAGDRKTTTVYADSVAAAVAQHAALTKVLRDMTQFLGGVGLSHHPIADQRRALALIHEAMGVLGVEERMAPRKDEGKLQPNGHGGYTATVGIPKLCKHGHSMEAGCPYNDSGNTRCPR